MFHSERPGLDPGRSARSRRWLTSSGRIAAVAMSEGDRQIHPHVHPDFDDLYPEVIAWSEQAAVRAGDDKVFLHVWDGDDLTGRIAVERGYEVTERWESYRRRRFDETAVPPSEVAEGYLVRVTRDDSADHLAVADLLNAAFGRTAHRPGELATFTALAPSFRRELDLVAEAADGTLAAYAAVCWDRTNLRGIFEPVCTHPDHRRRGLARALMLEGMRRARALGAAVIDVGTGDLDPANALYASLPFTEAFSGRYWVKTL